MKWLDRLFTKFGGMLGMAWLKIHCGVHTRLTLETEEKLQRLWYPFSWKAETEAHKVCVAVDWERSCAQTELLSKSEPQTESHRYFQLSCESRFGIVCVRVQSLSCVRPFVTPWTVACQAPLSMGFPTKNTGVGCNALLQGIFPTQGSNLHLLYCRQILYPLSHMGSSRFVIKLLLIWATLCSIFQDKKQRCSWWWSIIFSRSSHENGHGEHFFSPARASWHASRLAKKFVQVFLYDLLQNLLATWIFA